MKGLSKKDLTIVGIVIMLAFVFIKFIALINSIIVIGVLALICATILNRPVSFLERVGVHRTVATVVTMLILLGLIGGINAIIVPQVVKETKLIQEDIPEFQKKLETKISAFAKKQGIDIKNLGNSQLVQDKIEEFAPNLISGATKAGVSVISVVVHIVLILLLTVYILCDPRALIKGFLDPWNYKNRKLLRRCLLRVDQMLIAWAVGLCCGMICMFVLTWIGLSCIKMNGAFLFAVIAGFMNIIPTLGPFLAAILPLFITAVTNPINIIPVLLIYIIMHQIESHVMTPLIMKKQLAVHPFILILSILVMVIFFGMIGAFVTAPVMATLSIIYDEFVVKHRKVN